jgi:hypothetical protein
MLAAISKHDHAPMLVPLIHAWSKKQKYLIVNLLGTSSSDRFLYLFHCRCSGCINRWDIIIKNPNPSGSKRMRTSAIEHYCSISLGEGGNRLDSDGEVRGGRSRPVLAGMGTCDLVAMVIARENERGGGAAGSVRPN